MGYIRTVTRAETTPRHLCATGVVEGHHQAKNTTEHTQNITRPGDEDNAIKMENDGKRRRCLGQQQADQGFLPIPGLVMF